MDSPTEQHLLAAKRTLRSVQDTISFGVQYKYGGDEKLVVYVDSDYAGDSDDRKSTSGYTFMFEEGVVS